MLMPWWWFEDVEGSGGRFFQQILEEEETVTEQERRAQAVVDAISDLDPRVDAHYWLDEGVIVLEVKRNGKPVTRRFEHANQRAMAKWGRKAVQQVSKNPNDRAVIGTSAY